MTIPPSKKRRAGAEPALALNSPPAKAMMVAPSTRPMISGRMYWTFAALWSPNAPEMSRRKQAIQKPMLPGLPSMVSTRAARPTTAPVQITSQLIFFIRSSLSSQFFFENNAKFIITTVFENSQSFFMRRSGIFIVKIDYFGRSQSPSRMKRQKLSSRSVRI